MKKLVHHPSTITCVGTSDLQVADKEVADRKANTDAATTANPGFPVPGILWVVGSEEGGGWDQWDSFRARTRCPRGANEGDFGAGPGIVHKMVGTKADFFGGGADGDSNSRTTSRKTCVFDQFGHAVSGSEVVVWTAWPSASRAERDGASLTERVARDAREIRERICGVCGEWKENKSHSEVRRH